jgi:glutamyl/glutaminyl-tRNA synthetase
MEVCRFAPSTTGLAHPGTLLAALLCWLDARSRGARLLLRLEDLDPERSRPEWTLQMDRDLAWLGLDFDAREVQQEVGVRHAAALDRLAAAGRLYPCRCTRSQIEALGIPAPDGGYRYAGTCRGRALPAAGWRAVAEPVRLLLPKGSVEPTDEGGLDLRQDPSESMGDPIVRRRDGSVAYQLAVVVDDAAQGVTRVVRGRDIAPSTATQVVVQSLLGLPEIVYRHHLLLLEERGGKLAKLHGSVSLDALRGHYGPKELCGWLAHAAGLLALPEPKTPRDLLSIFEWSRIRGDDRCVRFDGRRLTLVV